MKKLISVLSCCCMLSMTAFIPVVSFAQGSTMGSKMKDKDGTVKMVDGKMMVMKGGTWVAMAGTTTMSNGTKVMGDGSVMTKDGKKKMLKNGDCVKPDGTVKAKM